MGEAIKQYTLPVSMCLLHFFVLSISEMEFNFDAAVFQYWLMKKKTECGQQTFTKYGMCGIITTGSEETVS